MKLDVLGTTKYNMRTFILVIVSIFCWQLVTYAQVKDEHEKRIKKEQLPKSIAETISHLPSGIKKVKFYEERDGNRQSFEAKFKYNAEFYSIEFDTLGKLEDIEVIIKPKNFQNGARKAIVDYFNKEFKKTKLLKIQKQYVFSDSISAEDFITSVLEKNIKTPINYEIVAEVTSKEKRNLLEFTFDETGKLLKTRTVVSPNYNYVLFEN